jgi:DNA-binding CsgD family transcriptional regulator
VLLGREQERRAIERVLGSARSGESATLALVGEPGIGKSALLDDAAAQAVGMRLLRARGVESEAQIPFASLLELLRPAMGLLGAIPDPQAVALEAALALRPARAQERFAVGAATLSLLAAFAEDGPVAVLLDDAQWLDGSSAQALLFAFRRLLADPIGILIAVREGEPSLLDGADLPALRVGGLGPDDALALVEFAAPGIDPTVARRLYGATAGNPLALLELGSDEPDLALAPEGAPLLVSARIARAFLRRVGTLDDDARRALALAATSDTGELAVLERAGASLGIDLSALAAAEETGLVSLRAGAIEFRHPLARSAIYAHTPPAERRAAHHALAGVLPDRDLDRRAWHLAAAVAGTDEAASSALEQAGARGRERSAYATASAAFERAGRLAPDPDHAAWLLWQGAECAWLAGHADRATALLEEGRAASSDPRTLVLIDHLSGHIATHCGPVMRGYAILAAAADRADPERAIVMLSDAGELSSVASRAAALLTPESSRRGRFLALSALGIARILGGDAAAGAAAIGEAVALAEESVELREDLQLLPWLVLGPIFLREADAGRDLIAAALRTARGRAAVGALAPMLHLVARDQATTDRWAVAESTYREAIALARECGQRTAVMFSLSGLAWLQARRGREEDCRALTGEALALGEGIETRLPEVWAIAAIGELDLGLGNATAAAGTFERQLAILAELGITDVDLSPAAELVDAYMRLGREEDARPVAARFAAAAEAKGQPWSLARAHRALGVLAADDAFTDTFEAALRFHAQTPDVFEEARTRLAWGERLRRAREKRAAREPLRAALAVFERLDARPWAERARVELAASGARLRRRDPSTVDELTPQELQIAVLLAAGRTTREAAAALFLSPKTIEYHLRHVYLKLDIHSREELAERFEAGGGGGRAVPPAAVR